MIRITLAASLLVLAAATSAPAAAQQPAADAAAAARDSLVARAQRSRFKGADSAPVMLVEVSDFQCPYCRQFAQTTYRQLDSAYVSTGQVRMLYLNLPLSIHRHSYAAAEAALCAGGQGQFWAMHDRLFAEQPAWRDAATFAPVAETFAQALHLDMTSFRDCIQNDRTASIVVSDAMEAAGSGIQGTPFFFLSGPGGRRQVTGAASWDELRTAVEAVRVASSQPDSTPRP